MASSAGENGASLVSLRTRSWVVSSSTSPVGILGLMASLARRRSLPTAAMTYSGRICSPLAWPSGTSSLSRTTWANTGAVAEVEEDEVAVVAAAVDPTHEDYGFSGVGGAQLSAHMSTFKIA